MTDAVENAVPSRIELPTSDGRRMPAWLWPAPDGTPAIVLFQEIFGVSSYIRQRAADLHGLGYSVVVPEMYWRLDDAEVDESADDALQQALAVSGRFDWALGVQDGAAALDWAKQECGIGGVMGFCFGGGLAFNVAAVTHPEVLVSYYGSAIPGLLDLAPDVTAPALYVFGGADDYISPDTVQRITAAVDTAPDVQVEVYDGAGHAFDNPSPMFHHAAASAAAWEVTQAFLLRMMPPG